MSLESSIADLVRASTELTGTVRGKSAEIDGKVAAKIAELDNWRSTARWELPFHRVTKNQFGNILNGALLGWSVDAGTTVTVAVKRDIVSGVAWGSRDPEEVAILTAMGMTGVRDFWPGIIRVLSLTWSKNPGTPNALLPFQVLPMRQGVTVASYARLISGAVDGSYLSGISSTWKQCGAYIGQYHGGGYAHIHPIASTDTGSIELILPAAVAGRYPVDHSNPSWGWFDHRSAVANFDTSI
ncbi:hypothetical protein HNO92_004292 [Chromobacterium alkanivorans]|uniref:hypothetical protein n=1 Tax=Chromobacterium alkanivorans TaxID=1071719 RepID=UPI002166D020|nr:hypothetical protein [Chromobacterium alkanivorans]MCS3806683.1 hypothetical protein [Chromobacterium alkanivorans]MCS3821145.1 hypothetical protein [Chromobacterium alkanivorans]MCS3875943.1 hypothetical protein [Chromobacterium alkanivorans]